MVPLDAYTKTVTENIKECKVRKWIKAKDIILESRLRPRWSRPHQFTLCNPPGGLFCCCTRVPSTPCPCCWGPIHSVSLLADPHAYPRSMQKPFPSLTVLLEGLQSFRSSDQAMTKFKKSPLNNEAHAPAMGPQLQLAHHFSHSVMMAPFLLLSMVPSSPLEIWFSVCANRPGRPVF